MKPSEMNEEQFKAIVRDNISAPDCPDCGAVLLRGFEAGATCAWKTTIIATEWKCVPCRKVWLSKIEQPGLKFFYDLDQEDEDCD